MPFFRPYLGFNWTNFTAYTPPPGCDGLSNDIVSPVVGSISAATQIDFLCADRGASYYIGVSILRRARALVKTPNLACKRMSNDVWSALARGCVAFSHTQAGTLIGTSFKDAGSLVASLIPGSTGTAKDRLTQLKKDISAAGDAFKPIAKAIEAEAKKAKDAVANMATELGTDPFTWEAAARATTELGYVLIALDAALDIIATTAAKPEPNLTTRARIETQIKNIREPWAALFRNLGAGTTCGFDSLCKTVLGIDNAGKKFANQLTWSREQRRLALTLVALGHVGLGTPGPRGATPISLDGTEVEAFFSYKDRAKLGIALRTRMRGDKMLEKIIPDQAPTANSDSFAIALDTKDGLTFGDGPNRKIVLPRPFIAIGRGSAQVASQGARALRRLTRSSIGAARGLCIAQLISFASGVKRDRWLNSKRSRLIERRVAPAARRDFVANIFLHATPSSTARA